jgi:hypothetical protein
MTWWITEIDIVDYTDRHGGLHWWITQMDMMDYTDGDEWTTPMD